MTASCALSTSNKRFTLEFSSADGLQTAFAESLQKGRAFVPDAHGVSLRELCTLEVRAPNGSRYEVLAEAVWVTPDGPGIGFDLQLENAEQLAALKTFVESAVAQGAPAATESQNRSQLPGGVRGRAETVHDRVRKLNMTEQQRWARRGSHAERVALERCYGGSVWEGLLQNTQTTASEVAKIAKKGNLPKPLVAVIVANGGWLSVPEIQRALLGNPRLSGPAITRVLRALSRRDLTRIPQQPSYRNIVRSEAKKLLKAPGN